MHLAHLGCRRAVPSSGNLFYLQLSLTQILVGRYCSIRPPYSLPSLPFNMPGEKYDGFIGRI